MIQMGGTVHDLAEAELCYAPQYGAAKDPVNVAGMMAGNALRGDMPLADWDAAAVHDGAAARRARAGRVRAGPPRRAPRTCRSRSCAGARARSRATARSGSTAPRGSARTSPSDSCGSEAWTRSTSPAATRPGGRCAMRVKPERYDPGRHTPMTQLLLMQSAPVWHGKAHFPYCVLQWCRPQVASV